MLVNKLYFVLSLTLVSICKRLNTLNSDQELAVKIDEYKRVDIIYKEKFKLLTETRQRLDELKRALNKEDSSSSSSSNETYIISSFITTFILATTFLLVIKFNIIYSKVFQREDDFDEHEKTYNSDYDFVANANRNSLKVIDASNEMYVREASSCVSVKGRHSTIGQQNELNDCCICMRSLEEIKQQQQQTFIENDENVASFKFTECGHLFCLCCMNKWFESRVYMTSKDEFKCPTCMRNVMRDNVIHVANAYI